MKKRKKKRLASKRKVNIIARTINAGADINKAVISFLIPGVDNITSLLKGNKT